MELEQGNVRRATRLSLCRFAWGWAAVCTAKQHRIWLCGLLSSRVRPLEASAKLTFTMLSPCVRTITLLSVCVSALWPLPPLESCSLAVCWRHALDV